MNQAEGIAAVKKTVQDLKEEGHDVRFENSYSGRGMYGERCVGIDCRERIDEAVIALGALNGLRGANVDQSGKHGVIVYWPKIKAVPDEEED